MGIWLIDADVLAGSRFRISALAETVATLGVLAGSRPHSPGQLTRPAQQRAAFQTRMADDPVGRAFLKAALLPTWLTDILCPPPDDDEHTFDDEMQRIRTASPAALRADLAGNDPALNVPNLPSRISAVLDWVWAETVEPDWQRRERAFEADIIARTRRLSTGGWASALDDMRPGMRWLGEGQLQINAYDYPPLDLTNGQLPAHPHHQRTRLGRLASTAPLFGGVLHGRRGRGVEQVVSSRVGSRYRAGPPGTRKADLVRDVWAVTASSRATALRWRGWDGRVGGGLVACVAILPAW